MIKKNIQTKDKLTPSSIRRITNSAWQHPSDPTIYTRVEILFRPLNEFVKKYNKNQDSKISLTHLFTKVLALTLEKYPKMNMVLTRGAMYTRLHVDIFVPVLLKHSGAIDLSGYRLRDAHLKTLQVIAAEADKKTRALRQDTDLEIRRVRKLLALLPLWLCHYPICFLNFLQYQLNIRLPLLGLPDDRFGSMILSSVGSFGINEAQIPLLAFSRTPYSVSFGKPHEAVIAKNGTPAVEKIVVLTFTGDHRLMDGVEAGQFLRYFKKICNNPEQYLKED